MDIANGLHTVFVRSETKRQEINALPLSWLFLPFDLYNSSSLIRTGCNICPFDLLLGRRLTFPSRQPDFWTSSRKLFQGAIAVASNDISSFHSIVNLQVLRWRFKKPPMGGREGWSEWVELPLLHFTGELLRLDKCT